jgi:hypothetical protein
VGLFALRGKRLGEALGTRSYYFRFQDPFYLIFEREVQECIQEKITLICYWVYLDRYDRIGLTRKREGKEMQVRVFHGLTCEDCDTQNSLIIDTGTDWIDWVCLDCRNEWSELIHSDERDDIDLTKLVYSIEQG